MLAMPLWGRHGDRRGHSRALLRCALFSGVLLALHALVFGYEELLLGRLLFGAAMAGAGRSGGRGRNERPLSSRVA